MRHAIVPLVTLVLAACGEESATSTAPPRDPPYPGIAAALTLDPEALPSYNVVFPAHYGVGVFRGLDSLPDARLITLGRVLFYDRQLSLSGRTSCASCHVQAEGFTDRARFSLGMDGVSRTTRHSMRLANTRFSRSGGFFWDERAPTLEALALEPIQSTVEMGFDSAAGGLDSLERRMRALPYYPELFAFAYGDSAITAERVAHAITAFVENLYSFRSRWDEGYARNYTPSEPRRGLDRPIATFTAQEERGRQLFLGPAGVGIGCALCHEPPTFALGNARSNGLDAGQVQVFKAPALKDVARTGPYMHDGRFGTLSEVVLFYNSGIQDGPELDPRLRDAQGRPRRFNLSGADQTALVAFLGTLNDDRLAADPRFADPFRR